MNPGTEPKNSLREEADMDFDPEDAHQYLEGVDYPASQEDEPRLPRRTAHPMICCPEDVVAELSAFPGAG